MKFNNYIKLGNSIIFKKPMYCILRITNRCNFRCRMCSVWKHRNIHNEATIEQLEDIAQKLKELGITIVNIGGGEPLLRNDINEIIKIFANDFDVRMQTNASLATESKVKEMIASGLQHVSISLDTLDPKKQNHICNSKDSWNRIMKGISNFSKYMPNGSLLLLNAVISKMNINELPNLVEFSNKIGFFSGFTPILLSNNEQHNDIYRDYAPDMGFGNGNYDTIKHNINKIIEMKTNGYKILNSYYFLHKISDFLTNTNKSWNCHAGRLYFEITPEGTFYPCSEISSKYSILDKDFVAEFNSKEFNNEMEAISKRCPGCVHPCWTECTHLATSFDAIKEKFLYEMSLRFGKRNHFEYEELISIANKLNDKIYKNK